jgi:hypothetical protein
VTEPSRSVEVPSASVLLFLFLGAADIRNHLVVDPESVAHPVSRATFYFIILAHKYRTMSAFGKSSSCCRR